MASIHNLKLPSSSSPVSLPFSSTLVSQHAIAHETNVIGIHNGSTTPSNHDNGNNGNRHPSNQQDWIKWNTPLSSTVCHVASTQDGSIVAASTSDGSVSILRGVDGSILTTKQISTAESASDSAHVHTSHKIAFIQSVADDGKNIRVSTKQNHNKNHTLVIYNLGDDASFDAIHVSGMDGVGLNSSNGKEVTQALQAMEVKGVKFSSQENISVSTNHPGESNVATSTSTKYAVEDLTGFFMGENDVRFFLIDQNGICSVHEYNIPSNESRLHRKELDLNGKGDDNDRNEEGESWVLERRGGIHLHHNEHGHGTFIVVAATSKSKLSKICWLDFNNLNLVSQYNIQPDSSNQEQRMDVDVGVMALCPLTICMYPGASFPSMAVAVAIQKIPGNHHDERQPSTEIVIVQGVIHSSTNASEVSMIIDDDIATNTTCDSKSPPSKFHTVYRIPVGDRSSTTGSSFHRTKTIDIISNKNSTHEGYGMWYKVICEDIRNDGIVEFKKFQPEPGNIIGRTKLLLAQGRVEEADHLLSSSPPETLQSVYGSVHISEIWLCKWLQLLSNEKMMKTQNKEQVKECLNRLTVSAVTGGQEGVRSLLKASRSLRRWTINKPDTKISVNVNENGTSLNAPFLRDFRLGLNVMALCFAKALKGASSKYVGILQEEKILLEAKARVFKDIETILEDKKNKVKLSTPLLQMNNHIELYFLLVRNSAFKVADCIRELSGAGEYVVTPDHIAESVTKIPSSINPKVYYLWLENSVFPEITVHHQVVESMISWCCRVVDELDCDNGYGIDAAILLLETFTRSMGKMVFNSHASFAFHSPFISNTPHDKCVPSMIDTSDVDSSMMSNESSCSLSRDQSLLGSATKQRGSGLVIDQSLVADDPHYTISSKLTQARIIKAARKFGLSFNKVRLSSFDEDGGEQFIAKELVKLFFSNTTTVTDQNEGKLHMLHEFCQLSNVCFDKAVAQYAEELCSRNVIDTSVLEQAARLVEVCSDPIVMCDTTLIFLRAALLSPTKPDCLKRVAKKAIQWAANDEIKSEIEEATRLLEIDEIVRRYCGNKAAEMFRISDPLHSTRLLDYVVRNIDSPSITSDVLFLCNAFTHLSALHFSVVLMERIIMATPLPGKSRTNQCADILNQIHDLDGRLAASVAERICLFCSDMIDDYASDLSESKSLKEDSKAQDFFVNVCSAATTICYTLAAKKTTMVTLSIGRQSTLFSKSSSQSWSELMREFQRIQSLFTEFGICISLSQLRNGSLHTSFMTRLILKGVDDMRAKSSEKKSLEMELTKGRRGCSLLFGDNLCVTTSKWCKAIGSVACNLIQNSREDEAIELLEASGLMNERHNDSAYQVIISIALTLCSRASNDSSSNVDDKQSDRAMRCIIIAASLLREHALVFCPSSLLPRMVFLSNLVDVADQVILRADCGVGEKMESFKEILHSKLRERKHPMIASGTKVPNNIGACTSTPKLHPTWHIGDGLLLSRFEALSRCMAYCRGLLASNSNRNPSDLLDVHGFLESRGAHSISLRMLLCASVVTACTKSERNRNLCQNQSNVAQDIIFQMAERSLGGSGTGNTNSKIDSLLAVSTLLYLPMKIAFKAYKRCLPSAMSRRDFGRVISLANVGQRTAGAESIFEEDSVIETGWKQQGNLLSQCRTLASKAYWWRILQYFSVNFDPSSFDSTISEAEVEKEISPLVSKLICNSSMMIKNASMVQMLATDFVKPFVAQSDLPQRLHIEYLLSLPKLDGGKDVRHCLHSCETAVKLLLRKLPSRRVRISVLRKCLINLEENEDSGKHFDRYSMLLTMHQNELHATLSNEVNNISRKMANGNKIGQYESRQDSLAVLRREIHLVERRQDALAILSAYFGENKDERPQFQKCFMPLSSALKGSDSASEKKRIGVLGQQGKDVEHIFDPMLPLLPYLKSDPGPSTSALAPICVSLGLPSGYIHARALIYRMLNAKLLSIPLPSFETEVYPIIRRLKSPKDGAELAEWCSKQYDDDSTERLSSLDVAMNLAIKASNVAEQAVRTKRGEDRREFVDEERSALERIKRLKTMKSCLSDIIMVKEVINGESGQSKGSINKEILFQIVEKARKQDGTEVMHDLPPEILVERLLFEGSLVTAEASLNSKTSLDLADLRCIASIIHKACNALAEQYSHIKTGQISRRLVRRWLVHGDEGNSSGAEEIAPQHKSVSKKIDEEVPIMNCSMMDDDDTQNLVLDLNAITRGEATWTDDINCEEPKKKKHKSITADEEQSSLRATTERELSEYLSARVGLRVAFVMSFATDFHPREVHDEKLEEENINPLQPRRSYLNENSAELHSRYLMKLVFSKSAFEGLKGDVTTFASHKSIGSGLATASINTKRISHRESKALTFAMRHRALRAASVLCPEDVLNRIVINEHFFGAEKCSLSKCCFGVFLAKEIEEMGLPLPHSDLVQLSVMHQPSYARTLWRHHGRSGFNKFEGRLMLLMLELALHEGKIVDASLVSSILTKIYSMNIPRTNLLVCECIARTKEVKGIFDAQNGEIGLLVSNIVQKLASSILHEIKSSNEAKNENVMTLRRLGTIIISFMNNSNTIIDVESLIATMNQTAEHCEETIRVCLFEVAISIIREVKNHSMKTGLLKKLKSGMKHHGDEFATLIGTPNTHPAVGNTGDCLTQLLQTDKSLYSSFTEDQLKLDNDSPVSMEL